MTKSATKPPKPIRLVASQGKPRVCGLCGRGTKKLTTTECCGNTICDDLHEYVTFSYARNSCYRNHSNQTICAFHHHETHPGPWQECELCRRDQVPELYAWYATNEYNFEKLENPPPFEPTLCDGCGKRIVLTEGGYMLSKGKHLCEACASPPLARRRPGSGRRRRGI
jgi:hypothetical protein